MPGTWKGYQSTDKSSAQYFSTPHSIVQTMVTIAGQYSSPCSTFYDVGVGEGEIFYHLPENKRCGWELRSHEIKNKMYGVLWNKLPSLARPSM